MYNTSVLINTPSTTQSVHERAPFKLSSSIVRLQHDTYLILYLYLTSIGDILRRNLRVLSNLQDFCWTTVKLKRTVEQKCSGHRLHIQQVFPLLWPSRYNYHGHTTLPLDYPGSAQSDLHPHNLDTYTHKCFQSTMLSTALRLYRMKYEYVALVAW